MNALRVLLVAYDYPPIVAAQALRWFYLANELAALGLEVHVLCPSMPALPAYVVPNHPLIIEHRVWPGPFMGLSQWLALRFGRTEVPATPATGVEPSLLFRAYRGIRSLLDRLVYPDVRTEWYPFARAKLSRLLTQESFDVVISSHEPGVDLLLGLYAKQRFDRPWIVDLADPLVTDSDSSALRQWLNLLLEGHAIRKADRVVITTERLRETLMVRHELSNSSRFVCIPQGAPTARNTMLRRTLTPDRLNIVFTGTFYEAFRNPESFANALRLLGSSDIRLTLAGDNARFRRVFDGIHNVDFVGRIGHFDCLALQQQADILLNIGNAQTYQIPGKVYEYLSAGRPILHLRVGSDDPSAGLLLETGLGWVVDNAPSAIATALRDLLADWRGGRLGVDRQRKDSCIATHGWPARARHLRAVIAQLVDSSTSSTSSARYAVVHDFLLVRGGAERLVKMLASVLEAPLITAFATSPMMADWEASTDARLVSLGCTLRTTLVRYLLTARRFDRLSASALNRDAVIYSGVIAPLAALRQIRGRRIYYCHSPPRFLYDLKSFYMDRASLPERLGLVLLDRWIRPRYERAVRQMDVVIANSDNVRHRLKRFIGVDAVVIYPPIETKQFRWVAAGDFFLSTARLEDFKRVDRIVQAFRRMPNQQLVVASGGRQEHALRQMAKGCSNICFTSWLTDAELAGLVGTCRAVIYIPMDEDFGMSPVEALAAGKPVIGVAEGGLRETLVDGITGILLPPDPDQDAVIDAVTAMTAPRALAMRRNCEIRAARFCAEDFLQEMRCLLPGFKPPFGQVLAADAEEHVIQKSRCGS